VRLFQISALQKQAESVNTLLPPNQSSEQRAVRNSCRPAKSFTMRHLKTSQRKYIKFMLQVQFWNSQTPALYEGLMMNHSGGKYF